MVVAWLTVEASSSGEGDGAGAGSRSSSPRNAKESQQSIRACRLQVSKPPRDAVKKERGTMTGTSEQIWVFSGEPRSIGLKNPYLRNMRNGAGSSPESGVVVVSKF